MTLYFSSCVRAKLNTFTAGINVKVRRRHSKKRGGGKKKRKDVARNGIYIAGKEAAFV